MLCEKCNKAEATVHITQVVADAPEEMKKRNFCVACFSQSDLAQTFGGRVLEEATRPGATSMILPKDEPDR